MRTSRPRRAFAFIGIAVLGLLASSPRAVTADPAWRTRLRVAEPTEIPGGLLLPGEYVVRVIDTKEARTIVQFCDRSETRVVATIVAVPFYVNRTSEASEFVYFERRAGAPPALRSWIYPGNDCGVRFVYGRSSRAAR